MARTRSKTAAGDDESKDVDERPAKRARVDLEEKRVEEIPAVAAENPPADADLEDEEGVEQEPMDGSRASDLYLDTVSTA